MTSKIDRTSLPQHKEYRLTVHHCPVKLQCQTHIRQSPSSSATDDDLPVIENYYCYRVGNQLVKVTKIKIGLETATLIDRISFHQDNNSIEEITRDSSSNSSAQEVPLEEEASRKKQFSVSVRKLLKTFESWVKENEPELLSIFKQTREKVKNDQELRKAFNFNSGLRQAFYRFIEYWGQCKLGRSIMELIKNWQNSFATAHKQYLREEEYLNMILSEAKSKQ